MAWNETLDDTHASLPISSSHSHCIFSLDHVHLTKRLINRLRVCGKVHPPFTQSYPSNKRTGSGLNVSTTRGGT